MKLGTLSIVLVSLLVIGCEATPRTRTQAARNTQAAQSRRETKSVLPKKDRGVWPYLSVSKESSTVLAPDLLAKNFVFVFDGSGSMRDPACGGGRPRILPAQEAAIRWERSVPPDANIGLVAFHSLGWTKIPPTRDRKVFEQAVNSIQAGGNTPLATAFKDAFQYLTRQAQLQLGYGEYTIVTTTDGQADSVPALSKRVERILKVSPVQIYTIGFCIAKNHTLNQPGRTIYRSANNPRELDEGLKDVLAESANFSVQDFKK
jgi:Ca-activated chloride channel homolog